MKLTEAQFDRAIYSLWDFQQALSSLTFLLEDCDFKQKYDKISLRRFRCYETNLIISMARPFTRSRGAATVGLRAMGIKLSDEEKKLKEKILELRNGLIAHSDENEMHFRLDPFPVLDRKFQFVHFQFVEGLHLTEDDLLKLETFLRRLRQEMIEFFFDLTQTHPELFKKYKKP